ncbi:MAG: LysM peptidoglycan-binding domain-containing protein [Proteobacteria bacterium]|nr:LysM peptidoglycan-binding domain-containing protein [Pseudomonadota bacterium]MDA0929487.1 LysM peptidoglycan-binding domain-containing protein [Pseudomonadota bacterium]
MRASPILPRNYLVFLLLGILLNACQSVSDPVEPAASDNNQHTVSSSEQTHPLDRQRPRPSQTANIPSLVEEAIGFDDIWHRIEAGLQLQEHYQRPEVEAQLRNYAGRQNYFDLVSQRAEPFLYWIVEEIEGRGLPLELALLPMVESTFNPSARSRDNAVGLWQFLPNTGEGYGLQQDFWYDGRRDPYASTRAALDYLEVLYQRFEEDWLLALAAYNTGGGNLSRAIRRAGAEVGEASFWDLPLARETQSHVPRLLALSRIIANPEHYDVELPPIANTNPLSPVEIGQQIELSQVASLIGVDIETIQALNPGYLQWATHPQSPQSLLIPSDQQQQLTAGLARLEPEQFVTWEHYRIQSGDTLSGIAAKLNTSVALLRTVNKINGSQIIAGRDLLIPRGLAASDSRLAQLRLPAGRLPVAVPKTYTVRQGDNLWTIARRFDLHSVDIAAWNGFDTDELLHPGQVLDLSFLQLNDDSVVATAPIVEIDDSFYVVRRGDSPAGIAGRLGLSVEDVLTWNQLAAGEIIYPGQRLRVRPMEGVLMND